MKLRYASLTDKGKTREHNEDTFLNSKTFALMLVADGMGGYQCGDIASRLALTSIIDYLKSCTDQSGIFSERAFHGAVHYANDCLLDYRRKNPEIKNMGTTLVAFAPGSAGGYAFNIGDSRLYRFRRSSLEQLTRDNSAEQEVLPDFMQSGGGSQYASVLTRALGMEAKVKLDSYIFDCAEEDTFLLCSDGLYSMVPKENLERILKQKVPLPDKCHRLVDAANEAGGEDNITVTLVSVESKADPEVLEMIEEK